MHGWFNKKKIYIQLCLKIVFHTSNNQRPTAYYNTKVCEYHEFKKYIYLLFISCHRFSTKLCSDKKKKMNNKLNYSSIMFNLLEI